MLRRARVPDGPNGARRNGAATRAAGTRRPRATGERKPRTPATRKARAACEGPADGEPAPGQPPSR